MENYVKDDVSLLRVLLHDLDVATEPWRIPAYWANYHDRLIREIRRSSLASLQNNYKLLKGFATGGTPIPIPPSHPVKRAIFEAIPRIPIVSKVFKEYDRLVKALQVKNITLQKRIAQRVLAQIEARFGPLKIPGNLVVGDAQDFFEHDGAVVTTSFVSYLCRAADFYSVVPAEDTTSFLEIGPGLGWSTLAHRTLNPYLRVFINVDIPSTLYISTQFLKAVGGLEAIDYSEFLRRGKTIVDPSGSDPVCYQIPPWSFESVSRPLDWLHNAFSFQEMEPEIVVAYACHTRSILSRGAWLMSSIEGHRIGAGGQTRQVSFDVIESAFESVLERDHVKMAEMSNLSGSLPDTCRLYRRLRPVKI